MVIASVASSSVKYAVDRNSPARSLAVCRAKSKPSQSHRPYQTLNISNMKEANSSSIRVISLLITMASMLLMIMSCASMLVVAHQPREQLDGLTTTILDSQHHTAYIKEVERQKHYHLRVGSGARSIDDKRDHETQRPFKDEPDMQMKESSNRNEQKIEHHQTIYNGDEVEQSIASIQSQIFQRSLETQPINEYFCGTSLEDASMSCEHACRGGSNDEWVGLISYLA